MKMPMLNRFYRAHARCQNFFTITARWHDDERMEIGRDLPVMADDWEINRFLRIFCRRRRDDELFQEHVKSNDAL